MTKVTVTKKTGCLMCFAWRLFLFNLTLGIIQSEIRKLPHRCHALKPFFRTVYVRIYHERSRMRLVRCVIQEHQNVLEKCSVSSKNLPQE